MLVVVVRADEKGAHAGDGADGVEIRHRADGFDHRDKDRPRILPVTYRGSFARPFALADDFRAPAFSGRYTAAAARRLSCSTSSAYGMTTPSNESHTLATASASRLCVRASVAIPFAASA